MKRFIHPTTREERLRDGAAAMAEYKANEEVVAKRTAHLRALRLAEADHPSLALKKRPVTVNKLAGGTARRGAVRKRSELKTKTVGEEHRTKRSKESGRFTDQKKVKPNPLSSSASRGRNSLVPTPSSNSTKLNACSKRDCSRRVRSPYFLRPRPGS